ncbi:MAG TPA: PspC domain-containing protein [Allosphingosinicella sp.]|nr:PspC domain-containing protein [Allosphingosinicella sp.]
MKIRGRRFEVDKAEGKLLGVCAGLANHTNVDATVIRIALVLVTLLGAFPWTVIAYVVAAMAAQPRRGAGYAPIRSAAREESRERMRNLDLRMQAIETYVTSSNSSLAREIEELR